MKFLKKLWDKCGEEKFTLQVMLSFVSACTLYNITCLDHSPEFNGFILILNILLVGIYLFCDD